MTKGVRRWVPRNLLGVVAVVAVLAGSGAVAYACGGGGGCGGGKCPQTGIYWVSYSPPVGSAANVRCAISITSSSTKLVESASELAPGQSCAFAAQLENAEDKDVKITETITSSEPSNCRLFGYSDNIAVVPAPIISSHHSFGYKGSVSLGSAAGNLCNKTGTVASFTIVITATPYVKCH
jgi:hypothetical protein